MGKITAFFNCQVYGRGATPQTPENTKIDLWMQDGRIIDPKTVDYECDNAVDCGGRIIAPGFIDLKLNGAYGVDFASLNPDQAQEQVESVARLLPRTGVTAFCPTITSADESYYRVVMPKVAKCTPANSAAILGFHMDGPFISESRRGAHAADLLRSYDTNKDQIDKDESGFPTEADRPHALVRIGNKPDSAFRTMQSVYCALEPVCLVTLAPELPGTTEVIRELSRWGIRVSLGHSACTFDEAIAAVEAGATMITHLFNAMPSFHHRDPSLVGLLAAGLPQNPYFGLIADGNHTHSAALRMAYRMAPDTLMLVTDGVAPLGLGLGNFAMGNLRVVVKMQNEQGHEDQPFVHCEGKMALLSSRSNSITAETSPLCVLADDPGTLYGSVAPMNVCIRNFMDATGCTLEYALEAASYRPALAMGIQKGTLTFGADADFVVLDPGTLDVYQTYIAGRLVFQS